MTLKQSAYINIFVCEGDVHKHKPLTGVVCFRRGNRTFHSPLSHTNTCSMLCSGMTTSWFAVGTQFQGWDRLVRSQSVDCASVSVEICFTTAKGILGSGSSAGNSSLLQSAQHYKKKKQMNNKNTVLHCIIPTRKKNAKWGMLSILVPAI